MTDYVVREKDRVFVFGSTSMFEYKFDIDKDGNELLDLCNSWQAGYLAESNKDNLRALMRESNEKSKPARFPKVAGNDYVITQGDRVFTFGDTKMYEYRFIIDSNRNELLDLFKVWERDDVTEDLKDKLRATTKQRNTGIKPNVIPPKPQPPQKTLEETTVGIDASLKKKTGKPPK